MAEYYTSFAADIDCPDEQGATDLAEAINKTLADMAEASDYPDSLESCEPMQVGDAWRLYIAGDNGLDACIPPIIQSYFKRWGCGTKTIISGNYGCSKARPGEFGGWAVGISETSIHWVDARDIMRAEMG